MAKALLAANTNPPIAPMAKIFLIIMHILLLLAVPLELTCDINGKHKANLS